MVGYLIVYAESFALTLVWVELLNWLGRKRRFLTGTRRGSIIRDLLPYATFLVLLPLILPGRPDLFTGLSSSFVVLTIGGFFSATLTASRCRRLLAGLELISCYVLVRSGVMIHFLADPRGGYVFLNEYSLPLTVLWLFLFAQLFKLANLVSGLFTGLVALFSYLVIGALLTQRSAQPGAALLAVAVAGATTCLWLAGHRHGSRCLTGPAVSLWSLTAAVLTVVATSKRVAFIALMTPTLLVIAPLLFFSGIIGFSYFGPSMRRDGERRVLQWNLTSERIVNVFMVFCLMGNLILLGHLFIGNFIWTVGLVIVAFTVFARTVRLVLVRGVTTERSSRDGTVRVLGTPFLAGGMTAAVWHVEQWLDGPRSGSPRMVITPDALALLRSLGDDDYCRALHRADLVVPDGAGVVWAGDIITDEPSLERVPGVELVDEILTVADRRGLKVYLLGTRSSILEKAAEEIGRRHPGIEVVGMRDGFFDDRENDLVVDQIGRSGADILLVAMGVPKQEIWMTTHGAKLPVQLMIGVGGTLDVMAGHVVRAPSWFQRAGLEWLHRIIEEPWRIKRAILLPVFVFEVLRQKIRLVGLDDSASSVSASNEWKSPCHP